MDMVKNFLKWCYKHIALLVFCVVFAGLIIYVLGAGKYSDEDIMAQLEARASQAYDAGDMKEAESLCQKLVEKAEDTYGLLHPNVVTAINNLALIYQTQGRFDEALIMFERALRTNEAILGLDEPDVAINLSNLALLYEAMDKFEQAKPLHARALTIAETSLGPDHPYVAVIKANISQLQKKDGR